MVTIYQRALVVVLQMVPFLGLLPTDKLVD
jgi:hypothetical protein